MADHPLFEIVTTTAGAISIRNKALNEIMHNPVGPWKEANDLYIDPSSFAWHLSQVSQKELVLFDVGLGAAANALAALHCWKKTPNARSLRIVSFERDLDLLEFALEHADQFEHFGGFETAMRTLLDKGSWGEGNLHWELRHGDFTALIENEKHHADLVFYDPYSFQVNGEMWTTSCFTKLLAKCKTSEEGGAVLYNYTRATPVRVALLTAGFFVGQGPATGLKPETTQASTTLSRLKQPLDARWLDRWSRSHVPYPPGCLPEEQDEMSWRVRSHPQFALSGEQKGQS
jgi:tRNA U34 5-methylaminomethyl-2-thiouridine-forming methyltransferase MnmC